MSQNAEAFPAKATTPGAFVTLAYNPKHPWADTRQVGGEVDPDSARDGERVAIHDPENDCTLMLTPNGRVERHDNGEHRQRVGNSGRVVAVASPQD